MSIAIKHYIDGGGRGWSLVDKKLTARSKFGNCKKYLSGGMVSDIARSTAPPLRNESELKTRKMKPFPIEE